MQIHIHIHVYVHVHVYVLAHVHVHVPAHVHEHVHVHVHVGIRDVGGLIAHRSCCFKVLRSVQGHGRMSLELLGLSEQPWNDGASLI